MATKAIYGPEFLLNLSNLRKGCFRRQEVQERKKTEESSGKLPFTYATLNPHNIWISKSVLSTDWNVLGVGSVLSLWALSEDDPGRHSLIPLQIILKDSVLSPRLFNMCLNSLAELICRFGAHLHLRAEEI